MSGIVQILLECFSVNINYYILVDGDVGSIEMLFGYFGLEVENVDVIEVVDCVCDVDDLGIIFEGGQIVSNIYFNFCVNCVGDFNVSGFFIERLVWFSFVVFIFGYVLIEGLVDNIYKLLDMQLVLFELIGIDCSGLLCELGSQYDD